MRRARHAGERCLKPWPRHAASIFAPEPQIVLILCLLLCALPAQGQQRPAAGRSARPLVQFRNAAPGVAYVGSKACAPCHADIYASYPKTDMGRSMSLPSQQKALAALAAPVKIKHPKANRFFEVYRRGSDFYQSEFELDAAGKEVFRDAHKLDYIVGSGANGFSAIVRRGDFLFEAPLSFYSKAQAWGLSPGYDQHDYSFSRPIEADCITCHSGRPRPIETSEGEFRNPPFLELPIGCESCHGPGALHVKERQSARPLNGALDRSIVNPAKLPGWLADNICMYCHQGMDSTALAPGKHYADFRPGTPLAETLAIFAVPFRRDAPPGDPLLQHFVLMTLSRCYVASGGRLHCITCHDSHQRATPAQAVPYYRAKCLTCHTEKSCKLSLAERKAKIPPDDCVGCHMPKQRLQAISHSSLTDHRILSHPGEPMPDIAFSAPVGPAPGLVYLDAIPGAPERPIPPPSLFRAYGELLASHPEYQTEFDAVLDTLAKAGSQDPAVLAALAMQKMNEGTAGSAAEATKDLKQAIRAGSTNPQTFELLATLQAKAGRTQDAIATLQKGLNADPYSPRLYRSLAALYVSVHAYDDALRTMKAGLDLFPEDSFMRSLISRADTSDK